MKITISKGIKVALACMGLLIGSGLLQAQHLYTLEECIAIARKNSIALRISESSIRSTRSAQEELKMTAMPQLKFGAGTIYAPTSKYFGYDPALSNGGQIAGQLILQTPLFDAGIRNLKSAQLDLELSRLSQEHYANDRDIIFGVKEAYIELLYAQETTALQQASAEQLSEYLDLVNRMYHGGNGSYTDVLKTTIQLASARIDVEQAMESKNIAKLSLAQAMGIPADTTIIASGTLEHLTMTTTDSLGTVVTDTSFTNLDLQMAQIEIEKDLIDVQLAQSERLPTILLNTDAGLLTSYDNLHLPTGERSSMLGASIGISIELPIFTWGAIDLRTEQRKLAVEIQQDQKEQLRRTLLIERQKTLIGLHKALHELVALRYNIVTSEENYSLTKSKYAAGGSLAIEVLSAQQLLVQTQTASLQSELDIRLLLAHLEQISAHQ
ncbi:MAG: TolC family protein [Bacteroidota bacterium]